MLYTLPCMQRHSWKLWAAAALSAGLLELPFPIAGPMPPWRSIFAWFGLAPLLWAVLHPTVTEGKRPLRRAFLIAYLCGFLWYCGNCYWVRNTMMKYGDMPPLAPTLLLCAFSAVLGLYFGLFGLGLQLVHQATKSNKLALAFAPFLWVALELAAARITSVPWDQLGYSQVDNQLALSVGPYTGVYGASFVLVAANALLLSGIREFRKPPIFSNRSRWSLVAIPQFWFVLVVIWLVRIGGAGIGYSAYSSTMPTAVLVQPNLDVGADMNWPGAEWNEHIAQFSKLAAQTCKSYIPGIPNGQGILLLKGEIGKDYSKWPFCPNVLPHPDLVVWPEAPAPFEEPDPRFRQAIADIAHAEQSPVIIGNIGMDPPSIDPSGQAQPSRYYNSALVIGADGERVGRYDKIHLVPFGEYIPFQNILSFAHKLTGRVSSFTRGEDRKVFLLSGSHGQRHRYGIFICYEAVFADEVRHFAQLGAQVLVNISDDGWYGDTSAPWQHLNMARMRAIENRRWILRDTNNGVTCVIDPYGRVRQSIPRHQPDALPAQFAFRDDITFYTVHGDVFAWLCAILSIGAVIYCLRPSLKATVVIRPRSR